jgi:hypothetical protein
MCCQLPSLFIDSVTNHFEKHLIVLLYWDLLTECSSSRGKVKLDSKKIPKAITTAVPWFDPS